MLQTVHPFLAMLNSKLKSNADTAQSFNCKPNADGQLLSTSALSMLQVQCIMDKYCPPLLSHCYKFNADIKFVHHCLVNVTSSMEINITVHHCSVSVTSSMQMDTYCPPLLSHCYKFNAVGRLLSKTAQSLLDVQWRYCSVIVTSSMQMETYCPPLLIHCYKFNADGQLLSKTAQSLLDVKWR